MGAGATVRSVCRSVELSLWSKFTECVWCGEDYHGKGGYLLFSLGSSVCQLGLGHTSRTD